MFNPDRTLLEFVGFNENGQNVSLEFYTIDTERKDYTYIIAMILAAMKEHFRHFFGNNENVFRERAQLVGGDILSDMYTNAAFHGNKNNPDKKVRLEVWLGSKGILLAIKDEGEFFKSVQTKQLVESREEIPSTRGPVGGDGLPNIYQADKIFVSTEENALYCAVIIMP